MIIDENTIHIIFSTLATIFGAFLGLLGLLAAFKYEGYETEINKAHNRIVEYNKEIGAAKREGNQEYENDRQEFLDVEMTHSKALKNEQMEYIRKFFFTAFLVTCILVCSIIVLPFSKTLINSNILINLNFGVVVVVFGVTFSIFVIFIIFLFLMSSFLKWNKIFRSDAQPKSKWYQFWKWIRWNELFFRF